jgi:hypothetical protein
MSVKQNTRSLKAALSVPLIFPAGDADAVAEIQDLYGYLRQRAAEKPLQTRVLSRVGEGLTADKKERWHKAVELHRAGLMSTIDTLISQLESDPPIDVHRKLSIARTVWSILQIEVESAVSALHLERIATTEDNNKNSAKTARDGKATLDKYLITKRRADEQRKREPDMSNTKIANAIRPDLNLELAGSNVSIFKTDETLAKFIGKIFMVDAPDGHRKFQRQQKSAGPD